MTPALLGAVMEAWDAVVEPALRTEGVVYYERREIRDRLLAAVRERLGKVEAEAVAAERERCLGCCDYQAAAPPSITHRDDFIGEAANGAYLNACDGIRGRIVSGGEWRTGSARPLASPVAAPSSDPAEFTSAEDVLVWLSGFGGGENQPTVAAVREAITFARADIADRLQTARADVYESVSRERDEASAALLTEQDRTAALRSSLSRLVDAAAPHVGAEYATEEETRALRNAIKNAREDMR